MSAAENIPANLARLRERIEVACTSSGRSAADVRLVAVTKRIPLDAVATAVGSGQLDLGENRLVDALPRQDELAELLGETPPAVRWHFIGHLQRNKAARAAGRFALIHGVHSLALAERLERRVQEIDRVQSVLLQVNITAEPQKDGLAPDDLESVACAVAALPHLDLQGLMAMARHGDPEPELRRTFAALRDLRDRTAPACGLALPELSMGMSGDFEAAIHEGATMLRVGTAVFGPREWHRS